MKRFLIYMIMIMPFFVEGQVDLGYQVPHNDILDLADAPPPPAIRINEAGTMAVMLYRKPYKSIQELSEKEMRLAGLRINPVTNIGSRTRYYFDAKILDVKSQKEFDIDGLPEDGRLAYFGWSLDESKMAFTVTGEEGVSLWVLDISKKTAMQITDEVINANTGRPYVWNNDNASMIVKFLPEDRDPLVDRSSSIPKGPTISVNDGKRAQNRTYQDLLKNPTDENNFDQLAHSVLFKVNLNGDKMKWQEKAIYRGVSRSPDGNYFMITKVMRPYSYLVPYYRFPSNISIYDKDGKLIKSLLDVPLVEDLPKGFMAERTGPRDHGWRSDHPSTIYWAEALDGGDPAVKVEKRDAIYQLEAPFNGEKQMLFKTKLRFNSIMWGDESLAIGVDYWWNSRMMRMSAIDPSSPGSEPVLLSERNYQDAYNDPGFPVMERNEYGRSVVMNDNGNIYMMGDGWSDEGKHPFIDKWNIKSGVKERLYRAENNDMLEDLATAIDMKKGIVLTRLESKNKFPNYYLRNINTGSLTPVTNHDNPFKAIQDVHKEVITYNRADGLELSATLYLPVGYDKSKKEKMPMLMWAYPREYKDKSSASQVRQSPNEFTYPYYGSPIYWVNRGYVVLDDAAFPIIGEGDEEPNDSFREQLVANGRAAIDAVDQLGYVDRNRVGVGGHSYGAFMVANLLSHSSDYAAGIARSGAYNRTLTPFGFQSEERNYWEAPEVYYTMSPFMHSEKMKTPLLLVHGEADNNSGTYPMQSERYFNALKGLGATVRLVMLPKESHGYAARESIMHMLWEQDQWLDKYVKNKGKEGKTLRP
ncbi:MAG: S9 family peptidase [Saprospiraceae bacterium]|nr:S9 family peptidase [Saprospiraceae bacterium]